MVNQVSERRNRGFAAMKGDQQREIARKGGETVSKNREHMVEIGRKGGVSRAANHKSRIARESGQDGR